MCTTCSHVLKAAPWYCRSHVWDDCQPSGTDCELPYAIFCLQNLQLCTAIGLMPHCSANMSKAYVFVQNTHKKRLLSKTSLGHVTSALTSLTTSSRPEADVHQDVLAGCTGNWLSHLDWGNER